MHRKQHCGSRDDGVSAALAHCVMHLNLVYLRDFQKNGWSVTLGHISFPMQCKVLNQLHKPHASLSPSVQIWILVFIISSMGFKTMLCQNVQTIHFPVNGKHIVSDTKSSTRQ